MTQSPQSSHTTHSNQHLRTRVLIVANALVALALGVLLLGQQSTAHAQPAADRARGDYTMVSGRFREGGSNVIYVIDSSNQEVVAVRWDQSKQQMIGVGYRSIANDARAARGR